MNKAIIGVLILLFLTVPVYAKNKQQAEHVITVDDIVAKMQEQLELTDQQAQAVKPIIENYIEQEKQLKLQEAKQLSKVLTGQQLFTWNFLQNEQQKNKKKKMKL